MIDGPEIKLWQVSVHVIILMHVNSKYIMHCIIHYGTDYDADIFGVWCL